METQSKISLWTGLILKGILCAFLLFDGIMKLIKYPEYVKGTVDFGLSETLVIPLGAYLLASTLLWIFPRTVMLGGLLLTAYLGAATAIMIHANLDGHPYLFPVIFTSLIWIAEYIFNPKLRNFIPMLK